MLRQAISGVLCDAHGLDSSFSGDGVPEVDLMDDDDRVSFASEAVRLLNLASVTRECPELASLRAYDDVVSTLCDPRIRYTAKASDNLFDVCTFASRRFAREYESA